MSEGDLVENFYGVYLLLSRNTRFSGRTYIGFTTDPNRRIKQHNTGKHAGGAWKTNDRGPWDMVLIVHGFPNDISALRFEWAWQHPEKSRRLRHLPKKRVREKKLQYNFRILSSMLHTGPWNRLPLTLRWLQEQYQTNWPVGSDPPLHMPVAYGKVKPKKVNNCATSQTDQLSSCFLCKKNAPKDKCLRCISSSCCMEAEILCLASHFLGDSGALLPVEGTCPRCHVNMLWGDLIRKHKGCYSELDASFEADDDDWTSQLTQR